MSDCNATKDMLIMSLGAVSSSFHWTWTEVDPSSVTSQHYIMFFCISLLI